jgi:hypothetical protein
MIFPFDVSLTKKQLDKLIAGERKFVSVHADEEFMWAWKYLENLGYDFDSWLDNPEEAIIEGLFKKGSES